MIKVEIQRWHNGQSELHEAEFYTMEEARQWADVMREHYGYRKAWINNIEYTGKE